MLARLVALCGRRPWPTVALAAAFGIAALAVAHARLGVSTDTGALFSASLPWKQRGAVLQRAFPQNEDLLVAVVTARLPEEADVTADALAAALRRDHDHVRAVREPVASPYFARNAFLFLDPAKLRSLLDRTVDAEPFLGELAQAPSLIGIARALGLLAQGEVHGGVDLAPYAGAIRTLTDNFASAVAGQPRRLSWENVLAGPLAAEAGPFRFVLVKPVLDYGALQPGLRASDAIRAAAARLPFVVDGSARVRITGSVALDDEEFASVAHGAAAGLIGATAAVVLWLVLAVRTWRLVVPIVLTLLLGLLLTTAFGALAIGTLNLISVAFAILFVGIAVDFAIQFSVRCRAERRDEPDLARAIAAAGRRCGAQILVAAVATAAGFLAFTPTAFAGVAELGLIAGVGMLIAFGCTVTALPALIAVFRPRGGVSEIGFVRLRPVDALLARRRHAVLLGAGLLALAGLAALPLLRFDGDPLHTKDPRTEAMRTVAALSRDPRTNPYTAELLLPSLAGATALARRFERLPLVADVTTLASFVPNDQAAKLAMIGDAADLLAPVLDVTPAPPPSVDAIRRALRALAAALPPAAARDPALRPLAKATMALASAPDARLVATDRDLTRFLPRALDRLRLALDARPVTVASVPPDIRRDWLLPDGRAHLEIQPVAAVRGPAALHRFVRSLARINPDVSGAAVTIVRSADTIIRAFRIASVAALLAIAALLALSLRRALDVALVLAPLLLSALLTALCCVLFGIALNFANIIALPLLLGVGTSFNIYFVMNWRAGERRPLASPSARAILFSALTTGSAFGSLALSGHPGTASMGRLLLLSLGCTLAATAVFVPALLAACGTPENNPSGPA